MILNPSAFDIDSPDMSVIYTRLNHRRRPLHLQSEQIGNHLAPGNPRRRPQSREVQRAGEGIGVSEEKHRRDPATGVLERKARRVHLVLLDLAAGQVVHRAGRVGLGLVGARYVGELRAVQDVEVVVGGVPTGVALSADGSAEDDQVLGNTWRCQPIIL